MSTDDPLAAAGLSGAQPGQGVAGGAIVVPPAGDQQDRAALRPPRWPDGAATGVGSMPGTDAAESAALVVGELPLLPNLPELPARGVGADMIGRTAALLVDLYVEYWPSGYRVAAHPGRDHRTGVDLLRFDVDAFDEACEPARPGWVKVQAAGPWTLAAGVELRTGHRVLTDRGAVREFAASLTEGLRVHLAEVATRTGAAVLLQLDEPSLPAVLAGQLPTASGYGTVPSVPDLLVAEVLRDMIAALEVPVAVHCCAPRPPVRLLSQLGAAALALDATLPEIAGSTAVPAVLDALGEVWDAGTPLLLGLVPSRDPGRDPSRDAGRDQSRDPGRDQSRDPGRDPSRDHGRDPGRDPGRATGRPLTYREPARLAFDLADRLGFDRARLATLAVPTPTCGLAGADPDWARRALALCRELAQAFLDPPESA
jgi:Cobalamin-independent synthase, Catalytic domain